MNTDTAITMLLAMGVAAVVSFLATPMVKNLAYKVGAIDVPKDNRRMHKVPIPRLGGLAIFLAFLLSALVFADIDRQMQGILLGAVMIVVLGVMDDIMALKALPKLIVQIAAAGVAVCGSVRRHPKTVILQSLQRVKVSQIFVCRREVRVRGDRPVKELNRVIDIALAAVSRQDGEVVIRLRNLGVGVDQLLIGCHRFIPPSQVLENRRALKHQGDIPLIFGEALIRVLERLRVVSVRDHPVHEDRIVLLSLRSLLLLGNRVKDRL